jgi:hypothetical protein
VSERMTVHELKTWPEPFAAVLSGAKRYEIRRDDRGFAVGDVLELQEWSPVSVLPGSSEVFGYMGREIRVRVTYKTAGGEWGLPSDLCVLSIEVLA